MWRLSSRSTCSASQVTAVLVLDPLEVGDGDAAGVGEDGGDDLDALLVRTRSPAGVHGALAASAMTLQSSHAGLLLLDHLLERGGDEHVDGRLVELLADRVGLGEAGDPAGPRSAVSNSGVQSMPSSLRRKPVWSATATILAPMSWRIRPPQPTLPKPRRLTRMPLSFDADASGSISTSTSTTPWPVAFSRPSEPPNSTGFPVTTRMASFAALPRGHHVGVGEPGHVLGVGADVGCGDVVLGPDDVGDGRAVSGG
jgi:hypothetical protein